MASSVYEKVFVYCERGFSAETGDPGFWGEPLNAVSNGAFILAGLAALWAVGQLRPENRSLYAWTLGLLMLLIGVGSFLFHTFAERWAGAMDVVPILMFILLAVYTLARRQIGLPIWAAWLCLAGFLGIAFLIARAPCPLGVLCISKGYFPALLALFFGGGLLSMMDRPDQKIAGRYMLAAGVVFTVSLTLRSLDRPFCDWFTIGDLRLGAHYWWHILNAVTLYLVTRGVWAQEAAQDEPTGRPLRAATP